MRSRSKLTQYQQIMASELDGASQSTVCSITIAVNDVNEPTTLLNQTLQVDENAPAGALTVNGVPALPVTVADEVS